MKARHAARELALLTLFQLDKQGNASLPESTSSQELLLQAVRALVAQARDQIRTAAEEMASVSQAILELEQEHPLNLATPFDAAVQPVPIPTTRAMMEKIEQCLLGAEYLFEALRIPELSALSQIEEVKSYALRLVKLVQTHQTTLDEELNQYAEDWRIDRLVKMDCYILRLALAEMRYIPQVDHSVVINEAVELAKEFSTAESFRFINGLLGKLAEVLAPDQPVEPQMSGDPLLTAERGHSV